MKTKFTKAELTEWTDALRDGKRKQGVGFLHRMGSSGDVFCCLGVLCDLHKDTLTVDNPLHRNRVVKYNKRSSTLPEILADRFGISSFGDFDKFNSLSIYNDKGFTFPEIADIIEQHFETVD